MARRSRFPRNRQEWAQEGREWVKSILFVLVIFLPLLTFVVQGFRIPSSSMEDTLLIGDFLFADKLTYGAKVPFTGEDRLPGFRQPRPGDIVIFESLPKVGEKPRSWVRSLFSPREKLIKRCVAVAGQTVEMRSKVLYVDGQPLNERSVRHKDPRYIPGRDDFGPLVVPANHIFCLGDNRDLSHDCRFFGPIPMRAVIAKADVLYFSFDPRKMLPRIWRIGKLL
jgi:signal peptidase I